MDFLEKFANVLVHPRIFFSKSETKTKPADVIKFALYCLAIGLIINSLNNVIKRYFIISFLFYDTIHVLTVSIGMFVVAVISAAISQEIGIVFFKINKRKLLNSLRVFSYYVSILLVFSPTSSLLAGFVPDKAISISTAILVFYLLYAIAVGLSVIHDVSLSRAFIMTILSTFLAMTALARIIDKAEDVIWSILRPLFRPIF